MQTSLENDHLRISVKSHGAELCSLLKKVNQLEYLWPGEPTYWGRHAPVLFPIVGRLKDDTYTFDGRRYELSQHGFARDSTFNLIEQTNRVLTYELTDSEASRAHYPFAFRLRLHYELDGNTLWTGYEVHNPADTKMYFSIGGHPAYRCPLHTDEARSDYRLVFERPETLSTQRLSSGIRNGYREPILENTRVLILRDELFDQDALIFQPQSDAIHLERNDDRLWTFHFAGFPYLGIWSKNRQSPFICVEPWFGIADHHKTAGELTQKGGIVGLGGGGTWSCRYGVTIH